LKVSYYPGCSLHATAKEYDQSVKAVSAALGIELKEVEDWSCCGATSAHSTNFKLSVALPARNLIAAEKDALDVMVPCAACFNRFKSAQHHLKDDPKLKKEIEKIVGWTYKGTARVRNPIDIIFNDIDKQAYPASLPVIAAKLRPGGLLIVDNMLWSGRIFDAGDHSPATAGVRELTRLLTEDGGWISTLLPIRDGLLVAIRVGASGG